MMPRRVARGPKEKTAPEGEIRGRLGSGRGNDRFAEVGKWHRFGRLTEVASFRFARGLALEYHADHGLRITNF